MKNKSLILLGLAFILLLGGAYLLYEQLVQGQTPDSLVIYQPAVSQSEPDSAPPETPPEHSQPEPEQPPATPAVQPEQVPLPGPEEKPTPEPEQPPPPAPEPEPEPEPESEPNADSDTVYAPDFTVYNKEGSPVHFSDFKGKPVVLNFWASWCGPCKSEMPAFEQAYRELGHKVQFLLINATDNYQETVESAASYIEGMGYTFPVFYDTKLDAINTYGIYAFPTTFFINENGELVAHAVSALSREVLQQGIDMILP